MCALGLRHFKMEGPVNELKEALKDKTHRCVEDVPPAGRPEKNWRAAPGKADILHSALRVSPSPVLRLFLEWSCFAAVYLLRLRAVSWLIFAIIIIMPKFAKSQMLAAC